MAKKITCLLMFILLISGYIAAQEQLKHEKKVYFSPDGRMYINRSLPVYLRLATSPDANAPSYLLKSEETPKYSNPMFFDTEGYNSFRSPFAVDTATKEVIYPQQEVIFEVYSDSRPPETTLRFGKSKSFVKSGKTYISGESALELKAVDEMSGVDKIYYSVNGEPYQVYSDKIALTEEKEYTIKYYAVDQVGNVEKVKNLIIILDKSTPKSKMNITGDQYQNILSGKVKIELFAEDFGSGVSKIVYQLDGNELKPYKYPFSTALLGQGEHTLIYHAVDNLDMEEEIHEFSFYIDKTPPTIMQEITGKTFFANGKEFSSGRAQLKLTTFDNKAGIKEVYYSINNQEYKLYEKPVFLTSASGNIAIRCYALDNVNNRSETDESSTQAKVPFIDLSGPSLNHTFKGPFFNIGDSVYISPKTQIMLKANDPDAGLSYIEYAIDNGETINYTQPFMVDQEGFHAIASTAYDNVENSSNHAFTFITDKTGPEIIERFSTLPVSKQNSEKNLSIYPPHVVLFIAATDLHAGFDRFTFSLNGQPEKPFQGSISPLSKPGNYTIVIKAYDKLGNMTEKTIEFAVGL